MAERILVGWGEAEITPKGGAISLIGQWEERVSNVVHDPIYAIAMVVQAGEERAIWVACDLVETTKLLSEDVKKLLHHSIPGFKDEQLILSATHIHTGPNTDDNPFATLLDGRGDPPDSIPTTECRRQISLAIESAVHQAVSSIKESRFEFAISNTITGVNRRATYSNGISEMYGDVHRADFRGMEGRDGGPMQLLYVRSASDGALTGVVAAVPCTAQCDEMGFYITADYWGTARKVIRDGLGEGVHVLGLIRSAGDLSPHRMVDCGKSINRIYGEEGALLMGQRVGDAVVRAVGDILYTAESDAALHHLCSNLELPIWTATNEQYLWAKEYLKTHDAELGPLTDMMAFSSANAYVKRYESDVQVYKANLHALRIGDIVLMSNPFELFIEYADRIRAACPEANVIDVELAGDEVLGYLATQRAIDSGGYSSMIFSGLFNAEGGEAIVEKSIEMIHKIMQDN